MTIKIKQQDGFGFNLWFPTSFMKSKTFKKMIIKNYNTDAEPLINSLPIIHKALKKYIKKNGHFTLVDITSADGDKVRIKV